MNAKAPLEAEEEVEAAVRRLHPHRTGENTYLHAKHFKKWRREAYPGEQLKTPPKEVALDVSSRHCIAHVAHRGDPTGAGMDCTGPNSKMYHQHTGHKPARDCTMLFVRCL